MLGMFMFIFMFMFIPAMFMLTAGAVLIKRLTLINKLIKFKIVSLKPRKIK